MNQTVVALERIKEKIKIGFALVLCTLLYLFADISQWYTIVLAIGISAGMVILMLFK